MFDFTLHHLSFKWDVLCMIFVLIDVYVWQISFWMCSSGGSLWVLYTTWNFNLILLYASQSGFSSGSKLTHSFFGKFTITKRCNLSSLCFRNPWCSNTTYSSFGTNFSMYVLSLFNGSMFYINSYWNLHLT